MSIAAKETSQMQTAHVLFMDVVGYSKLLVNEQREVLQQLNELCVRHRSLRRAMLEEN